jgi:hypothetical protein
LFHNHKGLILLRWFIVCLQTMRRQSVMPSASGSCTASTRASAAITAMNALIWLRTARSAFVRRVVGQGDGAAPEHVVVHAADADQPLVVPAACRSFPCQRRRTRSAPLRLLLASSESSPSKMGSAGPSRKSGKPPESQPSRPETGERQLLDSLGLSPSCLSAFCTWAPDSVVRASQRTSSHGSGRPGSRALGCV